MKYTTVCVYDCMGGMAFEEPTTFPTFIGSQLHHGYSTGEIKETMNK